MAIRAASAVAEWYRRRIERGVPGDDPQLASVVRRIKGFGTILAQNGWLPVLRTLGTSPWYGGRLQVSRAGSVFDAAGAIVDAKIADALRAFMAGFVGFVREKRP